MKKIFFSVASVAMLILSSCGNTSGQGSEEDKSAVNNGVEMPESAVSSAVNSGGVPTVLDFSAEWCPPCRKLKPIFSALKEEYAGSVDFKTINVDSMPELSAKYQISSIPALVYLDAEGKEVHRTIGFRSAEEIRTDIRNVFSKD